MTIQISVSAYRGVENADITLNRVALVGGRNGMGKTSLAQAAASAMTGMFAPGLKIKKNEAAVLLRRNSTEPSAAKVTYPEGSAMMQWPSCEWGNAGKVPNVSPFATGTVKLTHLDASERAAALSEYLDTTPSPEELKAALVIALPEVEDKNFPGILERVKQNGWDISEKLHREAATKAKGAWEHITGKKYGSKVAQDWIPDGYDSFSIVGDISTLENDITALKKRHSDAVTAKALAEVDTATLKADAEKLGERSTAVQAAEKAHEDAKGQVKAHMEKKPPAPQTAGMPPLHCPACDAELQIIDFGHAIAAYAGGPSAADIEGQTTAMSNWNMTLGTLEGNVISANTAYNAAVRDWEVSEKALRRLADIEAAPAAEEHLLPEVIDGEIRSKQHHIEAIADYRSAKQHHSAVLANLVVAELLSETGLRKVKLTSALVNINAALKAMADKASWKPVTITDDLSIRYGTFPYEFCSESEKFRANVMLQLAMVGMDKSPVMIIDAADILDADGKNGLFTLLGANPYQTAALVCMTASKKEHVADLAKFGLGNSYWIENGVVTPLGA